MSERRTPSTGGLLGWAAATDHKRTAKRVAATSLLWFLLAGLLALVMRSELARPGMQVVRTTSTTSSSRCTAR